MSVQNNRKWGEFDFSNVGLKTQAPCEPGFDWSEGFARSLIIINTAPYNQVRFELSWSCTRSGGTDTIKQLYIQGGITDDADYASGVFGGFSHAMI